MRSENSIKNSLYAIIGQVVSLLFGFITRIAFIRLLGEEYLGVNGVLYSILSLLSLAELGMGTAFTFSLYKPIEEQNEEKISKIMNLYAVSYRFVALAVAIIGLCLLPFTPYIAKDLENVVNIDFALILFVANSAASYLFSYKRALLTASQNDYKNSMNLNVFATIQNILQFAVLLLTKSYIFYLAVQLAVTLLSNVFISKSADKLFPYLKKYKGFPEKNELITIKSNVGSMFISRFGSVAVTGTDNLLIASIDVVLVGLYSNYLLILQTIQTVLTQVINAVTASVGNLIAEKGDKDGTTYRNIVFAVAWLYGFCAIALDVLTGRFITLAFGEGLEISIYAVHLMAINFLIAGLRQPNAMYINASGLFKYIKWRGFAEAAINLIVSCLFLYFGMGLIGILLGTTVSHLFVGIIWEIITVNNYAVTKGAKIYFRDTFIFLTALILSWYITSILTGFFKYTFGGFLLAILVTLTVPNAIILLFYFKTKRFAFFKNLILRMSLKLLKR